MENISLFLKALPKIGIRTEDGFQTSECWYFISLESRLMHVSGIADLFEGVNMSAVQACVENFRRAVQAKADVSADGRADFVLLFDVLVARVSPLPRFRPKLDSRREAPSTALPVVAR